MKRKYRNIAFLVELLINILVFSISCAILVGLFAQAWTMADDARTKGLAGAEVNALVERVKARGENGVTHGQWQADGSVLCGYTDDWQPENDLGKAAFTIRLEISSESTGAGTLYQLLAVAENVQGGEICRVDTASYVPT